MDDAQIRAIVSVLRDSRAALLDAHGFLNIPRVTETLLHLNDDGLKNLLDNAVKKAEEAVDKIDPLLADLDKDFHF